MGAAIGGVKSYRTLAISSRLFRAWATMRLRSLEGCVLMWALLEMHVVVLEMGAVDVWRKALTDIEELKLSDTSCCGGVADIFDSSTK